MEQLISPLRVVRETNNDLSNSIVMTIYVPKARVAAALQALRLNDSDLFYKLMFPKPRTPTV